MIRKLLVLALLVPLTSCGYLLYPERVGQTEGRLDPAILVLDAAGLLFGVIPGVVAFAVDISTGTIYLPSGEPDVIERHEERRSQFFPPLEPATVPSTVDRHALARQLSRALDRPVDPEDIGYYRSEADKQLVLRKLTKRSAEADDE